MKKRRLTATSAFSHGTFIFLSALTILPLVLLVILSVTDQVSILENGYSFWPEKFTSEGYNYLFVTNTQIWESYRTTIIVTVVGTIGATIVSSMLSYVLSRHSFRYNRFVSLFVFIPMIFHAGVIPSYMVNTQLYGLKNNILVLIIPSLVSCWNVVLLRTFYQDLPGEVIESALVDGANEFQIFYKVATPMAKPGVVTIALLYMLSFWNQWTPSMIYITDSSKQTLQYYVYRLIQDSTLMLEEAAMFGLDISNIPADVVKYSAAVVVMGPTLLLFPFFQKYFVRGISSGAVKG